MDYAQTFPQATPYTWGGARYTLNTDFAGGYIGVVTMMNDADSSVNFDDGFIRMYSVTAETLGRRGSTQVPSSLVNADGTVNRSNRLSEIEWYRSNLGFKTGALHNGDIVQIYGKGGFYNGDPELVDSEGIVSDGVEFNVIGHNAALAQPEYHATINEFYNPTLKNHYVKFFASKTGTNTVADQQGTPMPVYDRTGFSSMTLPGATGDLLQLTGVVTYEYYAPRFRCDSAVEASSVGVTNYPPESQVTAIPTGNQTGPIQLSAAVNTTHTYTLSPTDDAVVSSAKPTATTNNGTLYVQSESTGTYQNERSWLKFNLSTLPSGSTITGARLVMYCWGAYGAMLPTAVCGTTDPNATWAESSINWNSQPAFGSAVATQTLDDNIYDLPYTWDVTSYVPAELQRRR